MPLAPAGRDSAKQKKGKRLIIPFLTRGFAVLIGALLIGFASDLSLPAADSKFIVIALTQTARDCKVIPDSNLYAAIYTRMFGPASRAECDAWVRDHCSEAAPPDGIAQEQVIASVEQVRAVREKTPTTKLSVVAKGTTPTPGWTNPRLKLLGETNRIYYFEFVATPPREKQVPVATPIFTSTVIESVIPNTRGAKVSARANSRTSVGGLMSRTDPGRTRR